MIFLLVAANWIILARAIPTFPRDGNGAGQMSARDVPTLCVWTADFEKLKAT